MNADDISASKKKLRTEAQRIRDSIPLEHRAAKSQIISERIIEIIMQSLSSPISLSRYSQLSHSQHSQHPLSQLSQWPHLPAQTAAPTLLTYLPFRSEVDVMPIVRWCWDHHIQVAAPKVDTDVKRMHFYYIKNEHDIAPGAWNIPEPTTTFQLKDFPSIRWMLIPGLAFDSKLGRLGYGGGYYDRFFAEWAQMKLPLQTRIAAAFDEQLVPEVPTEPHDTIMSVVVSDSRIFDQLST